jgi:hypothetical protein
MTWSGSSNGNNSQTKGQDKVDSDSQPSSVVNCNLERQERDLTCP